MKILFVTSTRIGDAVLSTGLLSHLVSHFPEAQITVASGMLPAPLFERVPGVVRVISLTKQAFAGHWLGLWAEVARTAWDLVVDLRGSALAWTVVTRKRRVFRRGDDSLHRVEALAGLFDLQAAPSPRLWRSEADEAEACRLIVSGSPVLALGPTANWAAKIWPANSFVALLERLTGPQGILSGARVAVFGGPGERDIAQPVLDAIPRERCINLIGVVDLPVVAACLRRCALFIGNDSGLMHMSAAVGTPTLGLFGPSQAKHYAPWGAHCAVAETEISYDDLVGDPAFDHRATDSLMQSLPVETVVRETEALWRRHSGEAA
ncbi:MAG: glycosyltransferase family 9 protein [Rhodospirillaceae bacterium]|jgi:heptosyltransferase III|nr:glycosyltransferase family 9 protein [Rhodospirillaceae bacterium]